MNNQVRNCFSLAAILLLGACATPTVVTSVKPEDASMGCAAATGGKMASAPDTKSALLVQDDKPADAGVGASKEARLEELKRLFYLKYLSKEAYSEMKKGILDSP